MEGVSALLLLLLFIEIPERNATCVDATEHGVWSEFALFVSVHFMDARHTLVKQFLSLLMWFWNTSIEFVFVTIQSLNLWFQEHW